MAEAKKTVGDIFSDFHMENNLKNAIVSKINLFKKSNRLEIDLLSLEYIKLDNLVEFESYLKDRFMIEEIETVIKYDDNVVIPQIQDEWQSVIKYISHKYPFSEVLLHNSKVKLEENRLSVILSVNGADFLTLRGFDNVLQNTFYNILGKNYKIKFIEELVEEEINKIEQKCKMTEKYEIEKAISEMGQQDNEEDNDEIKEDMQNISVDADSGEDDVGEIIEIEEKTPLILGRSANIKENVVKISDISIDSGKVAIEGEIINIDTRELKSGKFLVIFDVYDGSSTITCKSFIEADKVKNILARLQEAKQIKICGTAQFDPFAKELGIIANIIVEMPAKKKQERQDLAKEKRVELHMHTQMSQMDGMTSATELIKRAMKWGWKSIAITDHRSCTSFPRSV